MNLIVTASSLIKHSTKSVHLGLQKNILLLDNQIQLMPYTQSLRHYASPTAKLSILPIKTVENKSNGFKSIPVIRSILSHIESIGVGMRPMQRDKNSRKMKRRTNIKNKGEVGLMNNAEEKEFFSRQPGQRIRKNKNGSYSTLFPPPPFASSYRGSEDLLNNRHKIKRLPVKILGEAATFEELPRSSKGIPEVAIVGRSNVGKSTLLNALLYGNINNAKSSENSSTERKYFRGKTPEGSKLPKGHKAVVSNKPGETRKLTFYQLSSQIVIPEAIQADGKGKKKMSIVLVDLPGYGFAFASDKNKMEWKLVVQKFILERGKSLKRILFLIDARHGFKKADIDFLVLLQNDLLYHDKNISGISEKKRLKRNLPPIQIILTKSDLVLQKDLARRVVQVRQKLSDVLTRESSLLPVMLVSAKAGLGYNNVRGEKAKGGILELQREIAALVPPPEILKIKDIVN